LDLDEKEILKEGYTINYIDSPDFNQKFDVWEVP